MHLTVTWCAIPYHLELCAWDCCVITLCAGTYSSGSADGCVNCPPGTYCTSASSQPLPCAAGYWSPGMVGTVISQVSAHLHEIAQPHFCWSYHLLVCALYVPIQMASPCKHPPSIFGLWTPNAHWCLLRRLHYNVTIVSTMIIRCAINTTWIVYAAISDDDLPSTCSRLYMYRQVNNQASTCYSQCMKYRRSKIL